jgi:hypothetical protein
MLGSGAVTSGLRVFSAACNSGTSTLVMMLLEKNGSPVGDDPAVAADTLPRDGDPT